jgi:hypothetical protein
MQTHNSVGKVSHNSHLNPNQSHVELHTPDLSVVPVHFLAAIYMLIENDIQVCPCIHG